MSEITVELFQHPKGDLLTVSQNGRERISLDRDEALKLRELLGEYLGRMAQPEFGDPDDEFAGGSCT